MNEPRWHVIASTGAANFVGEQLVAEKLAKEWDYQFPKSAPHRAARLVDATELEQANLMIEQQAKEIEALRSVLKEADDYLSNNRFNEIGSGSILHRQMQDALTGQ